MKQKKASRRRKSVLAKIFKPNEEKVFVAMAPFIPVVPILLYVVAGFFFSQDTSVGKFFHLVGFVSYSFISLFAIPFEGILEFLGMMEFGGGIFEVGVKGLNLFGILTVQLIYGLIFYAIFSITSFARKAITVKYSFGQRD